MQPIIIVLVRAIGPALGVLVGLLGIATLPVNLLGWFLFLAGVTYTAGSVIMLYLRKADLPEPSISRVPSLPPRHNRSRWLLFAGLLAAACLPPLELLYLEPWLPVTDWLQITGASLVTLSTGILIWTVRSSRLPYWERSNGSEGQQLTNEGPYRIIRHPGYAGFLVAALGIALGYASMWGFAALLFVLLPAVLWRIRSEEELLSSRLGSGFQEYASKTKRLIPGLW